jgi:uncharacterized iron-regulated protein
MKPTYYIGALLATLLVAIFATNSCAGGDRVFRTRDGEIIRFGQMISEISRMNLIFVGESHDSARDHQIQLDIIKSLNKAGVALAIGTEMFRADSQRQLDEWTKGALGLKDFLKVYRRDWNLPWPLYADIFLYARENRIPLIGLNVPEEITRKVSREGFSSLTDKELKQLPPGISCDVDPSYMDFIRRAYSVHGKEEKSFIHFCEAQMVWDKAMAWNLTEFLKENPRRTVVVLAGIGHSWKKGIPEQFRRMSPLSYSVLLPAVPEHVAGPAALSRDADYVLVE